MKKINPFILLLQQKAATDDIALIDGNKEYSYKKLLHTSQQVAQYLEAQGCKKGDKAILATAPGFELFTIIYATMIIEMQVALIDPHMGRQLYNKKLSQFDPKWAFIDSRLLLLQEHPILRFLYLRLKKTAPYIPFSKSYKKIATGIRLPLFQKHFYLKALSSKKEIKKTEFKDFKYIVTYTSGTIKAPKGVVHSISSVYKSIQIISTILKESKAKSIATHLPHFLLIGICSGIIVYKWDEKWSNSKKLSFIEKNKIEALFGPPAEYNLLLNHCRTNTIKFPKHLKLLLLGSAPVHKPFLKKLIKFINPHTHVKCIYGMTEHLVVSIADGREKIEYDTDGDLLGDPIENVKIKIEEDHEISVSSSQLFKEYYQLSPSQKMHRTGDLGKLDQNNKLILIGRKKDMIIRKNFNIYPALYEPTIKNIKGINEAVLIGVYDEDQADEKVLLFIESDLPLKEKQLLHELKHGKNNIDIEAIPDQIIIRKIPRTGRQQKINRQLLRNQYSI